MPEERLYRFGSGASARRPWRRRIDGAARIAEEGGVLRLCMGPSEALYYSNAELADGEFEDLPWSPPVVFEARARLTSMHYGSAGLGLWNHSMVLGLSNPVWFIYLRARGSYALQGLYAQSGRHLAPLARWGGRLAAAAARLAGALRLAPIRIHSPASREPVDPLAWHTYRVEYMGDRARFLVDGVLVAELPAEPTRVRADMWIDNAVYAPGADPGRVYRHVTQEQRREACMEIEWARLSWPMKP